MDLYQQTLMDHYRYPRNRGTLDKADFKSGVYNPSCGDKVAMEGCIQERVLIKIAFEGTGCVISQATASLLTELVINKSIDDIAALNKEFLQTVLGIELGPIRLKCALLPLQALQEGVAAFIKSNY
jgi:nitrogen fixation NifU-like protein